LSLLDALPICPQWRPVARRSASPADALLVVPPGLLAGASWRAARAGTAGRRGGGCSHQPRHLRRTARRLGPADAGRPRATARGCGGTVGDREPNAAGAPIAARRAAE